MGASPGTNAVKLATTTIEAARALGGSPRVIFDVSGGKVSGVTSEVVLSGEQAEVVAGRLQQARLIEDGELVERESIVQALRAGHENDSAADQVEFVSDLVGWSAEDDQGES